MRAPKNTKPGKPGCPPTKADRVEFIAALMREFKWRRKSGKELAEKWGIPYNTLKAYSAEASRLNAREVSDPDLITQTVGGLLLKSIMEAAEDADSYRGTKEGLTARDQVARLGRTWADICGSMPTQRVEITGALTPEQARKIVAERFGKVTPDAKKPQSED